MIPKAFLDSLLQKTDLLALLNEFTVMHPVGKGFKGLCPLHRERTPSLTITPDGRSWKCFGCRKGGDAIAFIRAVKQLDFPGAVEFLAERLNMVVPYEERDA